MKVRENFFETFLVEILAVGKLFFAVIKTFVNDLTLVLELLRWSLYGKCPKSALFDNDSAML